MFIEQGTGKPLRQFIHAKDVARLCVWALFQYDSTEPVMLAPEEDGEVYHAFVLGMYGLSGIHIILAFRYASPS